MQVLIERDCKPLMIYYNIQRFPGTSQVKSMQPNEELAQSADKTAIGLSLLCAIHCLTLPVAVALLPSAAALGLSDEWFHRVLLVFVLPVSIYALIAGWRKHGNQRILAVGIAGLIVLIIAAAGGHEMFGETGERLVTVVGSLLVAYSHLRNFRLCRVQTASSAKESGIESAGG